MVQWHENRKKGKLKFHFLFETNDEDDDPALRSQTCYFTLLTLFYVLTFGFVALTWKMFSLRFLPARFCLILLHLGLRLTVRSVSLCFFVLECEKKMKTGIT